MVIFSNRDNDDHDDDIDAEDDDNRDIGLVHSDRSHDDIEILDVSFFLLLLNFSGLWAVSQNIFMWP